MPKKFRIRGAKKAAKNIRKTKVALSAGMQAELKALAEDTADDAAALAPSDKGNLKSGIIVEPIEGGAGGFKVGPEKKYFYGLFHELGTTSYLIPRKNSKNRRRKALLIDGDFYHRAEHPGHPPRPFLRPAFDKNIKKLSPRFKRRFRRLVGK